MNSSCGRATDANVAPLLKKLFDNAQNNSSASKKGYRHDTTIKLFAVSLLILTGKSGYEFLQSNLGSALPSYATVQRMLSQKERIVEGTFYFDEVREHLQRWNAPLFVNVHLDDTRIKYRLEYDPNTDRYVGFVLPLKDGLPICDSFVFDTFEGIEQAYNTSTIAKYAHVVVIKSLNIDTPSIILVVLGTDSKYDHAIITLRWKYIKTEFLKRGIVVVSNGADGAGPFLKAMIQETRLFTTSNQTNVPCTWKFFLMPKIPEGNFHCQDTIHLLAKLRTRLLGHSNLIIFGAENVAVQHLQHVLDTMSKERHNLTQRTIDNKDKQNYGSIATLVSDDLMDCLLEIKSPKQRNQGTITFLRLMRSIRDANFDKTLSPIARVSLLWEVNFFLRIWKSWLKSNNYDETIHFITGNCYICVELNSHFLIGLLFNISQGKLPKEVMRIWTAGSQGCEQVFRLLRSMTPVFSTVINFTLKGVLERIHKLNYLASIESRDDIIFPRVKRRLMQLNEESDDTFDIPSLADIEAVVSEAKASAIRMAKECGMFLESYDDSKLAGGTSKIIENAVVFDGEPEESGESCEPDNEASEDSAPSTELNIIREDICVLNLRKQNSGGLPVYAQSGEKGTVSRKSYSKMTPFIKYKEAYIRKTTALYILKQENYQVSNDRLLRVRAEQPSHLYSKNNEQSRDPSHVLIGDLCIFRRVDCDKKVLLGRVVKFSYLKGTKKQREYSSSYVDTSKDSFKTIGVFANYFARYEIMNNENDKIHFRPLDLVFTAGYLSMEHFVTTIDETSVHASDQDGASFAIPASNMAEHIPQWVDLMSRISEFVMEED